MFPQTDSIFFNAFVETFKAYNLKEIVLLKSGFSIDKPNINTIAQICKEINFNGFIVSRLNLIHVTYTMNSISIEKKLGHRSGNGTF